MFADSTGEFWHIVIGAAVGAVIGAASSVVGQVVSGQTINWGAVGISAASGAITGAVTAACPGMGVVATGLLHGAVGAASYAATETLVYGNDLTLGGVLAAGITAGVLAGGAKALANYINKLKITDLAKNMKDWLGKDAKVITNQSGDKVFLSGDGLRRIRFDINNYSPHEGVHAHIEEFINGVWVKSGPIFPK